VEASIASVFTAAAVSDDDESQGDRLQGSPYLILEASPSLLDLIKSCGCNNDQTGLKFGLGGRRFCPQLSLRHDLDSSNQSVAVLL
jgi:hypothetical protein